MSVSFILSFEDLITSWVNIIPKLIYFICVSLMSVLDAFQWIMRKLAGLDVYYIGDSTSPETGDIALGFMREIFVTDSRFPALKNAFWALVILGIIFLIVATIIAIIRQEYLPGQESSKEKPSNNKLTIIKSSIRSLFMFLIVPLSCIFGLALGDIALQAMDSATTSTSTGGILLSNSTARSQLHSENIADTQTYCFFDIFEQGLPTRNLTFSGMMFKSAAYNANRVRINKEYGGVTYSQRLVGTVSTISHFDIFNLYADDKEKTAELIDEAFANHVFFKGTGQTPGSKPINVDSSFSSVVELGLWTITDEQQISNFSKFNVPLVWYYYDLWFFNYIVGFAFLIIAIKLFIDIILGLMKRIIEMVALFIISPPFIATMPLDEGKSFNKWRESFLQKALSVFACIIGMNLLFLIFPYLNQIKLFPETGDIAIVTALLNLMISSLMIIVGLTVINTFLAMVSKMIGAEDAAEAGGKLTEKVGSLVAGAARLTGGAAGLAMKAMGGGLAGKGARAIGKKIGKSGLANKIRDEGGFAGKFLTSKKTKEKIEQEHGQKFDREEKQKANEEFNEEIRQSQEYKEEQKNQEDAMDSAYGRYSMTTKASGAAALTREDWESSEKGQTAKAKIEQQILDTAEKRYSAGGRTRDVALKEKRDAYVKQGKAQRLQEIGTQRKARVSSAIGATGIKHIGLLTDLLQDEWKSAATKGGKGGFTAAQMAFMGKGLGDIAGFMEEKRLKKKEEAAYEVQKKAKAEQSQTKKK